MIAKDATLSIRRIPLSQLRVIESESCFPEKFSIYLTLLSEHPDLDVDPLIVRPSPSDYGAMHDILNGKHRYASSIMAGRDDVLCIVVEEASDTGVTIVLGANIFRVGGVVSEEEASE